MAIFVLALDKTTLFLSESIQIRQKHLRAGVIN